MVRKICQIPTRMLLGAEAKIQLVGGAAEWQQGEKGPNYRPSIVGWPSKASRESSPSSSSEFDLPDLDVGEQGDNPRRTQ